MSQSIARIAAVTMLVVAPLVASQPALAQFKQQHQKLVGTGGVGIAEQGSSVALSADGNTAVVGGPIDDSLAGAVWVFTRQNGVWHQQGQKLVGTGAAGTAEQGVSVSVSADGNTAIVGGLTDNSDAGAAWVFTRTSGVWGQQHHKLVGTGAVGAAFQGSSVALSGDGNTAIVGGPFDNSNAGAAWVFVRKNGVWKQRGPKLVGTGAGGIAHQGHSVALSADGNTAMVGGARDSDNLTMAWVFVRQNGVWTQQGHKLVGGDTHLGNVAVALSGDGNTGIVGAMGDNSDIGAAFVFTRNQNGVWTQQGNKLVGTGSVGASVRQGFSVALSGDGNTAVVGGSDDNSAAGATWVFTRRNGAWSQQAHKLHGTGAVGQAKQGWSVALSADGNTTLVGGSADNSFAGAAWVFAAAPVITTVSPASGPAAGNTTVTIKGRNFTGATAVRFGAPAARSFTVQDATTIVAHTPKHPAGAVAVSVTTPAGKASKTNAFTYQ